VTAQRPVRPEEPARLLPVSNGPGSAPDGQPRHEALRLPPGFSIETYSEDVPNGRSLAVGPKGVVFVSTLEDDRVYALVDDNGDHRVDRVQIVASGLDTPNGIAYRDGTLFVAEISRILRIDGIDARLAKPLEPVIVTDRLPDEAHHGWRYIRFGPDGWLYLPIGAACKTLAELRVTGDLPRRAFL